MMSTQRLLFLLGWLFLWGGQPARAVPVVNGSFDTGNFNGWTVFGNTSAAFVSGAAARTLPGAAVFSDGVTGAGIFQSLATTPGNSYEISYFLRNENGQGSNFFSISWGSSLVDSLQDAPVFFYPPFSHQVVATTLSTELRFFFQGEALWWIDDIVVTDLGSQGLAAVPELDPNQGVLPIALLLCGLLTLAGVRRGAQGSIGC